MILYQIAKWMEERKRLKRIIDESEGGNQLLEYRKEQVEQQMMQQANRWVEMEQVKVEPLIPSFVDPYMVQSLPAADSIATIG
ncbi:MAG: hypothetical protein K0R67_1540 [Paenibacillus sp.]|jgi:hypothetical protein|nr:hypothetical protein [Paenibacillus sp.]